MVSIAFVTAFIGASIGLVLGIIVVTELVNAIDCPEAGYGGHEKCLEVKDTSYAVVLILPIALFFALYSIMGGSFVGSQGLAKKQVQTTKAKIIIKDTGAFIGDSTNSVIKRMLLVIGLAKRND